MNITTAKDFSLPDLFIVMTAIAATILLLWRSAERARERLRAQRRIERDFERLLSADKQVPSFSAWISVCGVVPAGETVDLLDDQRVVYSDPARGELIAIGKRDGAFVPMGIEIVRSADFYIVDVRCAGRSQFAGTVGPVPAQCFNNNSDVPMDPLADTSRLTMAVRNTSSTDLTFLARVRGRYSPSVTRQGAQAASTSAHLGA